MSLAFVSIADDDTGASDIAGMLAEAGMRTIVVLDSASQDELRVWTKNADALVFAIASRALRPEDAYAKTVAALELVRPLQPQIVGIKYCSTFDSTPQGNIGPSIEAAMHVLREPFTVAVPALPVNGRTTYMGYHFVGRELLSDSTMRHHPLNPMDNPNLVSHLQAQTSRRVGLAAYPAVRAGMNSLKAELASLRQAGIEIAILDCTCNADLEVICNAISDMPLITGSSGLAMMLPAEWERRGYWMRSDAEDHGFVRPGSGHGVLVLSGSCSQTTAMQATAFEQLGKPSFVLDGIQLACGNLDVGGLAGRIVQYLESGTDVVIRTQCEREHVEAVHRWTARESLDPIAAGRRISSALGSIATHVVRHARPEGIVLAGGETSSVVCRMLGVKALRIGRNIAPGVPLCTSIEPPRMPFVLKSGNFGGREFFQEAADAIKALPCASEEVTRS